MSGVDFAAQWGLPEGFQPVRYPIPDNAKAVLRDLLRPMPFPEAYQNQGYNPSFPMNQGPPGSYSRPPPIHSPQPMQPPQGLPPGQHHPYMLSNDQRPPSMGMPPFPQHTINSNWYSNAPSYGAGGGTPRTLPSNDPHNGFPGRPG